MERCSQKFIETDWHNDSDLVPNAARRLRGEGFSADRLTMVFINGCFDILHPGHVRLFQHARSLRWLQSSRLFTVVAVNDDGSVRRLKGVGRPMLPFACRTAVVAAVEGVDWVVGFGEDTPEELIRALRPDLLIKGDEYRGQSIPGEDFLVANGGAVVWCPMERHLECQGGQGRAWSTTDIITHLHD